MARVLLNVPKVVPRGEAFEVRVLISHPMETGQRRDEEGRVVPRGIIHAFRCTYGGTEVLRLELFPAIAANPFLAFSVQASDSGPLLLEWETDAGETQQQLAWVEVA